MPSAVENSLKNLGNYRVKRAQVVAKEGGDDGISGALLLALTLRETWGRNIEGGAKLSNGRWVALDSHNPEDAKRMDVGAFQINRGYHPDALRRMVAVKAGTWGPAISGKTPLDAGYVPRFEEQIHFTIREMREAIAYAEDHGVPKSQRVRFAVAAHNAGMGGALSGFKAGNVDKYTALGNYSEDILGKRSEVNAWLARHDGWRA